MKRMPSVVIAVISSLVWAAALADNAMTSTKSLGEVSIVPEPKLVNGELILKVVALNQGRKTAAFGPQDIQISTADGQAVSIMTLGALIAQVKGDAGPAHSGSYSSSYTSGPTTTYSQSGQPDVHNFRGSSTPVGGQVGPGSSAATAHRDPAVQAQIEGLKAGILQDITIAPGEVKGGEVVTRPIKFHWREKHTLRITILFNGEQHEFDLPAPTEE